jgi:transaldolase
LSKQTIFRTFGSSRIFGLIKNKMETNKVKQIHSFGQSIWLDFIDRAIISSGKLKSLIDVDGVRGVTSNPAIFEKAITSSSDYDADIHTLNDGKKTNEEIFFGLAIADIQNATKLFEGVYDESKGEDGYVSLEVSPFLALDAEGTAKQAEELWKKVDRKNVMIKIPGTKPGLKAIRESIGKGININVTLLFGLPRYEEVTEAYISGLEDHLAAGHKIGHISSVASFFLSRIDVLVDPLLDEKGLGNLKGEVAIASAKKAYEIYKRVFSGPRWEKLAAEGAQTQRLLWASTSSKNPAFKDTKYVEALIGADTVDTVPLETIEAFRDHGVAANTLEEGLDNATTILQKIKAAGIDIDKLTQQLEDEGIEKFNKPFEKLLQAIEDQKSKV